MMRRLFELVAEREEVIKKASLDKSAFLGRIAGALLRNPGKTLMAAGEVANVAGSAQKTEDIANQVAQNVARTPRDVGPTM